jgi:quinol monooxygenase YgiN
MDAKSTAVVLIEYLKSTRSGARKLSSKNGTRMNELGINNEESGRRGFMRNAAAVAAGLAVVGASREAEAAAAAEDTCCTLVPYFEVAEGKMPEFTAFWPKFIALTRTEPGCLHYAFSSSGQAAHCREGYADAAAVLAHLDNVGPTLGEALKISKLTRLEVHGPAAEIEKLRQPMAKLNPQFFILASGGFRK